mgnify:CR=1 FL=1
MPLQSFLQTWYGFTFFMLLTCFIYSMGISSWVLTPVNEPVKLAAIVAPPLYHYNRNSRYIILSPLSSLRSLSSARLPRCHLRLYRMESLSDGSDVAAGDYHVAVDMGRDKGHQVCTVPGCTV